MSCQELLRFLYIYEQLYISGIFDITFSIFNFEPLYFAIYMYNKYAADDFENIQSKIWKISVNDRNIVAK